MDNILKKWEIMIWSMTLEELVSLAMMGKHFVSRINLDNPLSLPIQQVLCDLILIVD